MIPERKLLLIKMLHTVIWLFFNLVIFYMLYAVIVNKIDRWLWICYSLIGLEVITLLLFRLFCPLTVWARKYSDSSKPNFDIFLPQWLAKNNKLIYTIIIVVISIILVWRLVQK